MDARWRTWWIKQQKGQEYLYKTLKDHRSNTIYHWSKAGEKTRDQEWHSHYGRRPLPRVPNALGEDPKTLGEGFPKTLGEGLPGKRFTEKRPSPSAKYRALGEAFHECRGRSQGRFNVVGAISHFFYFFTLPWVQHSGKKFPFFLKPLPRVQHSGKKFIFFRKCLPRVPYALALGETPFVFLKKLAFSECPFPSTRGRMGLFFKKKLPRVGKSLFFLLPCE
jgi:hypothetical protein